MINLWPNSGFHLLERNSDGYLGVTDEFIRLYLERPELEPIPESCDHERQLHANLMDEPWGNVSDDEILRIKDPDSRANFRLFLSLRDMLLRAGNIENAYMSLFKEGAITVPPVLIQNMVQVILQNILGDTTDAYKAKASELFFRDQMLSLNAGAILMGDREKLDVLVTQTSGLGDIGRMMAESGITAKPDELAVLNDANTDFFWQHSDRFDMILDATYTRKGLEAFCQVMAMWIKHFLHTDVKITPVQTVTDERWVWHIGLDKDATELLNDLYNEREIEPVRLDRLVSLFQLDFVNSEDMRADIKGSPIHMGLCMGDRNIMTFKPQNLLFNLPLAQSSAGTAN